MFFSLEKMIQKAAAIANKMSASLSTSTEEETQYLIDTYREKTEKQQILDNPDTFVGSVELTTEKRWVWDAEMGSMVNKEISFVPALLKLFDEAIVNCRDHAVRMETKPEAKPVTFIHVTVGETGEISMENDGNGIDVAQHPVTGLWIPEMIFGHLRNSTNYNKEEKKIVGGKNGYGVKLIFIWSLWGEIETVDHTRKLKYTQRFGPHLNELSAPIVTKCSEKPRTKIRFLPDYARLGLPTNGLSADMMGLFQRRTLDIAILTNKRVQVKWNGQELLEKKLCNWKHYIHLYFPTTSEETEKKPMVWETDRWEVAVLHSPFHEFTQISFVNGIHTSKGGKHVDYLVDQITRKMADWIEKKKKTRVASASIKEQLMIFVRCDIENPSFDSQTKENLTTNVRQFGSTCEFSTEFIEKLAKSGIAEYACQSTELKTSKSLAKLTKPTSGHVNKIRGIPKLSDAELAGTSRSHECTLLLCEGDSAKAGIESGLAGLTEEERRRIGVFPLKGKLLNVKEKTPTEIYHNEEIQAIIRILGLEIGKKYTPEQVQKQLRYGKIRFVCDADVDGSHIKGLCMNLFETLWVELFQLPGFLGYMYTPILKAKLGQITHSFYTEKEYEDWVAATPNSHQWKIKYYKGLGTSVKQEFMEYFRNQQMVEYCYTGNSCLESMELAFHKKKQDLRKEWILNKTATPDTTTAPTTRSVKQSITSFVHDELVFFSMEDCIRSIPSVVDGWKPGMRKIMYCAFKKPLINEIKVAQFAGYVSEHSCYHHGEASLNQTIIGMAQNFVGSNNIALLRPNGQFGTRVMGGKDASQERYIFTQLNPITRKIFPALDDPILTYLTDQETKVEPRFYAPILPMVLVNGAHGIGTGFSTDIMCYSPKDLVAWLQAKLLGDLPTSPTDFLPYYEGFRGKVLRSKESQFSFHGNYQVKAEDKLEITELPIGVWYQDYKNFLKELEDPTPKKTAPPTTSTKSALIKILCLRNTDDQFYAEIEFTQKGKLQELIDTGKLESTLRLVVTKSTTNQVLFDSQGKIHLYSNLEEILEEFYLTRLQLYHERREYQLKELRKKMILEQNRARYIQELIAGKLDLRNQSKQKIHEMLSLAGYHSTDAADPETETETEQKDGGGGGGFEYLLKMRNDSVCTEKMQHILQEKEKTEAEYLSLLSKTIESIWLEELAAFTTAYQIYLEEHFALTQLTPPTTTAPKKRRARAKQ